MAKPKLALIPAAQGSKFYSVLPSDGVGDFDFARASAATRINKYGLIETVASGQSRLNYPLIDGVVKGCPHHILEPARTNLIQYSEDFSNAAWNKSNSSITSNAAISPDGSLNADKLIENTANNTHYTSQNSTASNEVYTYSVYVKPDTITRVRVQMSDLTTGDVRLDYDFTTETKAHNTSGSRGSWSSIGYTITNISNGWLRLSLSALKGAGSVASCSVFLLDASGNSIYTGNGTSGLFVWGAQLEQGSYPTSYIPTSGTAVTRSAETANNSGDASTFNDSEGVLMAEISALADDITNRIISISDGSGSNRVLVKYDNSSNLIQASCTVGTDQASLLYYANDITINAKVLFLYKSNDFQLWVDGFKRDFDVSGLTPSGLDRLNFDNSSGASNFYGNTKQIQYYDSALTDSELETLTSWTSFSEMATSQLYSIQ